MKYECEKEKKKENQLDKEKSNQLDLGENKETFKLLNIFLKINFLNISN